MKIALFGVTGSLGSAVAQEALEREHQVTGLARRPERSSLNHPNLTLRAVDLLDVDAVVAAVAGHEAVVSAYAPNPENPATLSMAAHNLLAGLQKAGVSRLITIGGAGSLQVAPGLDLLDTPDFPPSWRPLASAHRDALSVYRQNGSLDWTYFSPAALIAPGTRTGQYRTGGDLLLTDSEGQSTISNEDFAVAILDELEQPHFKRQRITVAY